MADFWVTNASKRENIIEYVKAIEVKQGQTSATQSEVDAGKRYEKYLVIQSIKNNKWFTCHKMQTLYTLSSPIHVVKAGGKEYIRTDANEIEEDNLGDLPKI